MKPKHTDVALNLAARSCGTNTPELAEHGMDRSTASGVLANLVAAGRMFRVEGERQPQGVVVHQFFTSKQHAEAWARVAPMYRPNMRLRQSSRSSTSGTSQRHPLKRRDPDASIPSPFGPALPGVLGEGSRYYVPATFKGELSALKPGQYATEPASCAARRYDCVSPCVEAARTRGDMGQIYSIDSAQTCAARAVR